MHIGLYNRQLATLGGGERYGLALADLLRRHHTVTLLGDSGLDYGWLQQRVLSRFGLSLDGIAYRSVEPRAARRGDFTRDYDLFINASHGSFVPPQARRNALLVFFPLQPARGLLASTSAHLRYTVGHGLSHLPPPLYSALIGRREGLHERIQNLISPRFLNAVRRYDAIWAISHFTQRWISRYWQLPSDILYPPVQVDAFGSDAPLKEQSILSVGRFFAGHHNKKHLLLIAAFRQLVDAGLRGWTLRLAGGTDSASAHRAYLARVREAARGYPIAIHEDFPFDKLIELYRRSAIYWHASGAGEAEEHAPEKMEHFGITTVEAMAAGCVPVVIARGGQPEVVEDGQSGFLWQTVDELRNKTQQLLADATLRREMSLAARRQAQRFDHASFDARAAALVARLTS